MGDWEDYDYEYEARRQAEERKEAMQVLAWVAGFMVVVGGIVYGILQIWP